MAVGDAVSGISGDNTLLDFQPASGVVVIMTSFGLDPAGGNNPELYDGSVASGIGTGLTIGSLGLGNSKVVLTNTNYLRLPAQGAGKRAHYTGIQIQ